MGLLTRIMGPKSAPPERPRLLVQKVDANAELPQYQTEGAGCFGLAVPYSFHIGTGDTMVVDTGLKVQVPDGYVLEILSRSGWAGRGLTVANAPGIIDSDYRGHLLILLRADGKFDIEAGTRVAQARLVRVEDVDIVEGLVQLDTARGSQGLGSTGE